MKTQTSTLNQPAIPLLGAATCSAAVCQWESVVPGPCQNNAEYTDPTGKRLCWYHASHLERRFGTKMLRIEPPPATHQCCRCKNKHTEADRWQKKTGQGAWSSRCPKCNGESYYDLTKKPQNDQRSAARDKKTMNKTEEHNRGLAASILLGHRVMRTHKRFIEEVGIDEAARRFNILTQLDRSRRTPTRLSNRQRETLARISHEKLCKRLRYQIQRSLQLVEQLEAQFPLEDFRTTGVM